MLFSKQPERSKIKKVYLIGIKGVGMSALAVFLKQMGLDVSGSDTSEIFPTDKILKHNNIPYFQGFSEDNLQINPDLIIISAAFGKENPEVKYAKKKRMNIQYYSEALAYFASNKKTIAVS